MVWTRSPADGLPPSQRQHHWEQAWQRVMAFQQQHGRLPRIKGDASCPLAPDERPLGRWCLDQQRRKAGSKHPPLTALQQAGLAAIPGWLWWARQRANVKWDQRLQQLEAFARQQGRLPRRTAGKAKPYLPGEQELGRWMNAQHQRYKGQKGAQLSTEEVTALEAVPGWAWAHFVQQPWDERRQQVEEFVQQHGRLPRFGAGKSSPFVPGERQLGQWCNFQRQRRKGNIHCGPPLRVEQQAALEALPGWWWEKRSPWEVQYQRVAAFIERHERRPRARGSKGAPLVAGEKELATWWYNQQQRWSGSLKPALTAEQQAALAALPGRAWDVRHDRWEQLEAFVRQHGRLPRLRATPQEPLLKGERQLASWCRNQRSQVKGYRSFAPLSAQRAAALEGTPHWAA